MSDELHYHAILRHIAAGVGIFGAAGAAPARLPSQDIHTTIGFSEKLPSIRFASPHRDIGPKDNIAQGAEHSKSVISTLEAALTGLPSSFGSWTSQSAESRVMAGSRMSVFTDPQAYQAAVRPAEVEVVVTTKGDFRAELTRVELPRLWLQRGREKLPRVAYAAVPVERPPFFFSTTCDQAAVHHSGMNVSFGEIVAAAAGSTHHLRSGGPCHWATMSLTRDDLAAAGHVLVGRDVAMPAITRRLRPDPLLMSRLLSLHEATGQLAEVAPQILDQPEPARALEQALVHALVMCLADDNSLETGSGARRHWAIIAQFEDFLAENLDRPLYVPEICAGIGVVERTLRICCQEHLGMGPARYLRLRRMHLARRALIRATPATATVASIAMDHGFWELGRFSVRYRALFGESPSASLRRPPDDRQTSRARRLAL